MTMHVEAWWLGWGRLLLGVALLTLGCAQGPRAAATLRDDRAVGTFPLPSFPSSSSPESSAPQPLYRRWSARGPGTEVATMQRKQVAGRATARDTTPTCAGQPLPPGWPDLSSMNSEALLAPFLACTPTEFVALQDRLDMPRLVERLDDWSAVRLGALAREKQLTRTLGNMARVQEHLRQRGLLLSDYPDRPERPGDSLRGAREGLGTIVSSTPLLQWGEAMAYDDYKSQLPPDYRQALVKVEAALVEEGLSSGHTALGVVDEVTFGIPLGTWHLVAGTTQGLSSLSRGQYEQATRELTPAALVVAVYAGGKGLRLLSESRGAGTGEGSAASRSRSCALGWRKW